MRLFLASAAALMIASTPASACSFIAKGLDICGAIDKLDANMKLAIEGILKELEETRKVIEKTANAAIRAVPGERYLQLIDDLNSGDENKRKQAQSFLRNLAGIDPQTQHQATLRFVVAPGKTLRYDWYRLTLPIPEQVDHFADMSLNLQPARSSLLAVNDAAELKKKLLARYGSAYDVLSGPRTVVRGELNRVPRQVPTMRYAFSYDDPFTAPYANASNAGSPQQPYIGELEGRLKARDGRRAAFAEHLASASLGLIQGEVNLSADGATTFDWHLLDRKNYLAIVIDEESFKTNEDFTIVASVHVKGDSTKTLNQRPPYHFKKKDFEGNRSVTGKNGVVLRWAFHEFTGDPSVDAAALAAVKELRGVLARWEAEQRGAAPKQ